MSRTRRAYKDVTKETECSCPENRHPPRCLTQYKCLTQVQLSASLDAQVLYVASTAEYARRVPIVGKRGDHFLG